VDKLATSKEELDAKVNAAITDVSRPLLCM